MKKFSKVTMKIISILVLSVLMIACSEDDTSESVLETNISTEGDYGLQETSDVKLPHKVENQLNMVKENLAKHMGETLQLIDYKVVGRTQAKSLNTTLDAISNANSAFAYGNIADPETVNIGSMKVLIPSKVNKGKSIMKQHASEQIEAGDLAMELTWNYKGEPIKTLAFYDSEGIKWDNMMIGLIILDTEPKIEKKEIVEMKNGTRALTDETERRWNARWLWGSERGSMFVSVRIRHNGVGTNVINTTVQDGANITIGSAVSESKITRRTGRFGEARYALGMATPTARLAFNGARFEVELSGFGSNVVRNGTLDVFPK